MLLLISRFQQTSDYGLDAFCFAFVLKVVSNGRFQSVEHRVVTNTSAARLSVTTFLHPDADVMLGPALDLVDASHPPLYPTTKYSDYRRAFHRKGLNGKVLVKPAGR
jgi:2'-deoxymugineic-acid 2'-dioxygenase/mugineic-acid 3-dioxygenase